MQRMLIGLLVMGVIWVAFPRTVTEVVYIEVPVEVIVETELDLDEFPSFIAHTTAYTAGYESTGKRPGHPAYGITASGAHVEEGRTIAMSRDFPFGTLVMIEGFNEVFEVQDRGGAIVNNNLDIYMKDLDRALEHGRRDLRVWILKWGGQD